MLRRLGQTVGIVRPLLLCALLVGCAPERASPAAQSDVTGGNWFLADATTKDLERQSNGRLWALYRHFLIRDREAWPLVLDELVRREDPGALRDWGVLHLYDDRTRAIQMLRRAAQQGEPRSIEILARLDRGEEP